MLLDSNLFISLFQEVGSIIGKVLNFNNVYFKFINL